MTSVNTNASATTALRTLQATNRALDTTQNRISTGLKIGEAKDNAAYWAISTTLKSDNKSLATVKDALGLGAATVDVAYQGLNKAKEVLDQIKVKLTAATQDGVDRNIIQAEIGELQNQLTSISSSSTFSGENWLSIDSSSSTFSAVKQIVSSFSRDANNSVSIGTVSVDTVNLALFDASTDATKSGIIDKSASLKDSTGRDLTIGGTTQTGNALTGGLGPVSQTGTEAVKAKSIFTGTFASSTLDADDTITLTYAVDGGSAVTRTITAADAAGLATPGTIASVDDLVSTVNNRLATAGETRVAAVKTADGKFALQRTEGGAGHTVAVTAWTGNDPTLSITGKLATGGTNTPGTNGATFAKSTDNGTYASITLGDADDGVSFTYTDDVGTQAGTITVTRADAIAAGFANGVLASVADFAAAANKALVRAGNTEVTASDNGGKFAITANANVGARNIALTAFAAVDTDAAIDNQFGLANAAGTVNGSAAVSAKATGAMAFPVGGVTLDTDDKLYFDVALNGGAAKTIAIDKTTVDAALKTATSPKVTMGAFDAKGLSGDTINVGVTINGASASYGLTGLSSTTTVQQFADKFNALSAFTTAGGVASVENGRLVLSTATGGATTSIEVTSVSAPSVNANASVGGLRVAARQQGTDAAITADGKISTVRDMAAVVDYALKQAGVSGMVVSTTGNALSFESLSSDATSKVAVSNVAASAGATQMSIDKLDISTEGLKKLNALTGDDVRKVLSSYITVVNEAITKITSAAANLGAVASRIDLQNTFVDTLMDTIDKGVGNLIDADLSEESTRLQALQTKQQLGVQALSIANSGTQQILRLFQTN